MPNSPHALIHYKQALKNHDCNAVTVYDLFSSNGWDVKWVAQYGSSQPSHYHSTAHEAMAVLSGTATIRFGSGDILSEGVEVDKEDGGIEIQADPGDIFVLPAGLAHKTFNPIEGSSLHFFDPEKPAEIGTTKRETLARAPISGFTMIGAYPEGCSWNWANGGDDVGNFSRIWSLPRPPKDPVLGASDRGLRGLWAEQA